MSLRSLPTVLPEVLILEPKVFGDNRGFFFESFNAASFTKATGIERTFVQDNHSRSSRNVLRGLHYQVRRPQGKLVRVTCGEVLDVAVDIRRSSPNFGKWVAVHLSAENKRQLWIPEGFAHGFLVLTEFADFLYKTTDYWAPEHERCIVWDDPDLAIDWCGIKDPIVSEKDSLGVPLNAAEVFA
ncbi:dTDP-4-dehydrorhamnose 3,5-epimerase [Cupriavidus cauae]|uniref:dTDP-4-dehydrorhamnose 3,5-epimerase n=1 Tax=Cupriavidus cauae TaxID=2608999 RepID=UPI0022431D49|nr:dTDP-4-dehydrorhamnose 3,5-epimerase [Cupriavidus cauae]UZN50263.1 dTDP-4-dehydrorhamnose 3,5-epimerase [Cupriavidus cauae]